LRPVQYTWRGAPVFEEPRARMAVGAWVVVGL